MIVRDPSILGRSVYGRRVSVRHLGDSCWTGSEGLGETGRGLPDLPSYGHTNVSGHQTITPLKAKPVSPLGKAYLNSTVLRYMSIHVI